MLIKKTIISAALFAASIGTASANMASDAYAQSEVRLDGFAGKKVVVMDDITMAAVAGLDHQAVAQVEKFSTGDTWTNGRNVSAAVLTLSEKMGKPASQVIAERRELARQADYWVVPVNSVSIGTVDHHRYADFKNHLQALEADNNIRNLARKLDLAPKTPLVLDGRDVSDERRTRLSSTEAGGALVCNEWSKQGVCVHIPNVNNSTGVNSMPKWLMVPNSSIRKISTLASQAYYGVPTNMVYAIVVKPTKTTPALIKGVASVEGEAIQGVVINTSSMTRLIQFNQDYTAVRESNPFIGY